MQPAPTVSVAIAVVALVNLRVMVRPSRELPWQLLQTGGVIMCFTLVLCYGFTSLTTMFFVSQYVPSPMPELVAIPNVGVANSSL